MKKLSQQYKNLISTLLILGIICICSFFFLIRPQLKKLKKTHKEVARAKRKMSEKSWPADIERLKSLLYVYNKKLQDKSGIQPLPINKMGLESLSKKIIKDATKVFAPIISQYNSSSERFRQRLSRFDFESDLDTLERNMKDKGIFFHPDVLNLSKNTDCEAGCKYQLALQTSALEMIINQVLKSGMQIMHHPTKTIKVGRYPQYVSNVSVLPPIAYYLSKNNSNPYVVEFPIRLHITGTTKQLIHLLENLQTEDHFFPVNHMQIYTKPEISSTYKEYSLNNKENVIVEIECSCFFNYSDKGATESTNNSKKELPRGA